MFFINLITMKFNKWLATNISMDVVYDDILKKTQLKEVLGVGLTVKLKNSAFFPHSRSTDVLFPENGQLINTFAPSNTGAF